MLVSRRVRPLSAALFVFVLSCADATGPQSVATITVTPPAATLASGGTITLSAATLDQSGAVLTGRAVTWRTSDPAIATVSPTGVVTAGEVAGGSNAQVTITASSGSTEGTATLNVTPVAVGSVTLTAATATLASGGTLPITPTVRAASGTVLTGRTITWSSTDSVIASVSASGLVTASEQTNAAPSPVTISATSGGVIGSIALTVSPAAATVVIVTPSTLALDSDGTTTLVAVVRSASGATLAGRVVTWQSSAPAVATVTTAGLVTAGRVLAGVAAPVTITATSDGIEGSAALTVRPVPVWSVNVDPLAAFDGTLDFGESVALGATMRDDAGSELTGRAVDWSVGSGPVTVSAGGVVLAGEVTAAAPELANVRATSEGVESYEALYVAPLPVATVTVTPNTSSYFVRAEQQLTATPRSAGGTALTGRAVVWTTSDTTRAVIFSSGLLRALGRGAVTLSATVEGQVGSVSITVSGWERIATGAYHACAVASSGPTYCWGAGAQGELGNGTTTPASRPSPIAGAAQFSQLTGGDSSTCGIRSFIVDCWGRNEEGQIGDSTVTNRLVPTGQRASAYQSELPVQIDAGEAHGCLLTDVGALYCWGDNTLGELGDGTTTDRLVPTTVPALTVIYSQVSAGSFHTCAVTTLSRIHCWGANGAGQLGDASFTNRRLPVLVQSAVLFTQVSAGNGHSCAISTSGGAYCWGQNISGELGDGGTTSRPTVAPVSGGLLFTSVRTGSGHTCALTSAGAVYCWGENTYGQLGDGTFTSRSVPAPVRVDAGSGLVFVTLDVGANFTCGITTRAVLYCWGENSAGQLGNEFPGGAMLEPYPVLPPL